MFEASVHVLVSDEFLALVQSIVDSFGCTPVEAANLAVILPCFFVFMVTALAIFVLHLLIDDALSLLYRLFKSLKAQHQKRKEKSR